MRKQSGFSLIEVLVALTILVIGLLGLAGLQFASLRWTADAAQTAAVARLGQEMAEKLRARPGTLDAYVQAARGAPAAERACYAASGCPTSAGVATDLAEWLDAVAQSLPAGRATLCRDASPEDGSVADAACSGGAGDPVVMKFWWTARDSHGRATEATALTRPLAVIPVRP